MAFANQSPITGLMSFSFAMPSDYTRAIVSWEGNGTISLCAGPGVLRIINEPTAVGMASELS